MTGWGYLAGYGYLAVLLGTAEFIGRRTKIPTEVTRKVLHCLIGLEWLVLYFFFANTWQIVVIPATFVVVNALSYKFKFFRSIEREEHNHPGTIFYALAMTGMSIATAINQDMMIPFGVATFCLSFGDGAAALAGKYLKPNRPVFDKTLNGSIACFAFAYLAQILLFAIIGKPFAWRGFAMIAAICALAELLSGKGLDNVLICAWCFVTAYATYYAPEILGKVLMCFGGFVLAGVTARTKLFTYPAAILSGVMLATVGLWGGWGAYATILGCFALTACVEKLCHVPHHSARNTAQVLQNGLAAWVAILLYRILKIDALQYVFVVGVAQSMCDSVASAVGRLSKNEPVDILRHKRIAKGTSGGISLVGTLGAVGMACLPALGAYYVGGWAWAQLPVFGLPVLGMMWDSVLGASIQRKYECVMCGTETECLSHCSHPTAHKRGLKWCGNGSVNLIANICTCVVAFLAVFWL